MASLAFPRTTLVALAAMSLAGAPVFALMAQAGGPAPAPAAKIRSAKVGTIDGFTFIYSVQNNVPSCVAQIRNEQGQLASFTAKPASRPGSTGNVYGLVLPSLPIIDPGTRLKVQLESKTASSWSREYDAVAQQNGLEATFSGPPLPASAPLSFVASAILPPARAMPIAAWRSEQTDNPREATGWLRLMSGLDLCLAGKQVR